MKILNLYAGVGGNRELWGDTHNITAVEIIPEIADVYSQKFPNDTVIVGDACSFLENNFKDFDFIWSSPPCPSHGQLRHNVGVLAKNFKPIIPDMTLYAQIVFLKTYFSGMWVVENVKPYYKPLIQPDFVLQRHLFWSSGIVPNRIFEPSEIRTKNKLSDFNDSHVKNSKIKNKRQVLRNCVNSELGLYIFNFLTQEGNYEKNSTSYTNPKMV